MKKVCLNYFVYPSLERERWLFNRFSAMSVASMINPRQAKRENTG